MEDQTPAKLRGAYYTSPDLARFLSAWAAPPGARVLEPGCGDGAFVSALAELGGRAREVLGLELEPKEAAKARACLKTGKVERADFLAWFLAPKQRPPFDAVVGNPPYVRYQYLSEESQRRAEQIFDRLELPFTRHTNLWVAFVLAALSLLRPGGRLAMAIPAELLHVLHAQPLRDQLARQCRRVLVIDPEEIWFEETLQGVVLLLAEVKEAPAERCRLSLLPVKGMDFLKRGADRCFEEACFADAALLTGKWTAALLTGSERALLGLLENQPGVRRLGELAKVDVGIVTGANAFFLVDDATVAEHGLQQYAHPMFGRSEHVRGVIYDQEAHAENRRRGLPANFLWIREPMARLPPAVQRYLRTGVRAGLPQRYKCRIRTPWYSVPSVWASPISMLKRSHDCPRLVLNLAGALTTDTAYRLQPKVDPLALVGSFLNSLTLLSAELEGRHYGGGVLELVPSEIERLLLPLADCDSDQLRALDLTVRAGAGPSAWLGPQDARILGRLGLSSARQEELRLAWDRLRRRRQRVGDEAAEDAA